MCNHSMTMHGSNAMSSAVCPRAKWNPQSNFIPLSSIGLLKVPQHLALKVHDPAWDFAAG